MNPFFPLPWILLIVGAILSGCMGTRQQAGSPDAPYREGVSAGLEEIYIVRTTRTGYTHGATAACSAAPFTAASEQQYDTWSLVVRPTDAKVVKTHEQRIGDFMACFGGIAPNGTFPRYSRGTHDSVNYTGTGECKFMQSKAPAPKLLVLNCSLDLSAMPSDYIGGYITASSLAPAGGKDAADVRGYLSTSVITMRLWKQPK